MPFTFAHPAYALPLERVFKRYMSMTGIILGSMAPDFEYFIALEPYQHIGHTLKGLLFEAVPLSLLFAFLFHHVVKEMLALHLPSIWQLDQRASALVQNHAWRLRSIRDWIVFLLSVAIGFYSHVVIDGFTHASGAAVRRWPWLSEEIVSIPIYKYLQHGLSLLGLAILGLWMLRVLRSIPTDSLKPAFIRASEKYAYWTIVLLSAVLVWGLKLILAASSNLIGITVVASLSGAMLGILLASWIMRHRHAGRRNRQ